MIKKFADEILESMEELPLLYKVYASYQKKLESGDPDTQSVASSVVPDDQTDKIKMLTHQVDEL